MASEEDVTEVFESWRSRQSAPDRVKLTPDRAALIRSRLRAHEASELVDLIAYAFEANTPEARFWRGENDRNQRYLGLDNLLVQSKLADRIDRARAWAEGNEDSPGSSDSEEPLVLSPIGQLRRGGGA